MVVVEMKVSNLLGALTLVAGQRSQCVHGVDDVYWLNNLPLDFRLAGGSNDCLTIPLPVVAPPAKNMTYSLGFIPKCRKVLVKADVEEWCP